MNFSDFSLQNVLFAVGLCCVLPSLILCGIAIFAVIRGSQAINETSAALQQRFDAMQAAHADRPRDAFVQQIIQRQAFKSGIVGALTSVGGLPILPFGLALDLYSTSRIQNELLSFIALAYSTNAGAPQPLQIADVYKISGLSGQAVAATTQQFSGFVFRRIMLIVAEKAAAKLVPVIGLVVGFAVNYFTMRGAGSVAAAWSAGKYNHVIGLANEIGTNKVVRGAIETVKTVSTHNSPQS